MDDIRPTSPQNSLPARQIPNNLKVLLLILALGLVVGLGYFVWFQNNLPIDSGGDTIIKPKVTTPKTTTTTDSVYTNSTYGYSMTFNDKWAGYKIKTVVPTDGSATAYLHVNLPTTSTDALWAKDGTTNLAGYASVMAINVFTPAQWAALDGTPGQGTKLAENAHYVFSYSRAQDFPTDLQAAASDIPTVVATFKLN